MEKEILEILNDKLPGSNPLITKGYWIDEAGRYCVKTKLQYIKHNEDYTSETIYIFGSDGINAFLKKIKDGK